MAFPGINGTGLPNTNYLSLGRGKLYAAKLDVDGNPLGFRDLGNAPSLTLTIETETLEHFSSRQGTRVKDAECVIEQSANLTFALDEANFENLALLFNGEADNDYDNSAAVAGVSGAAIQVEATDGQGKWYDIYDLVGGLPALPAGESPHDHRMYEIGAVTFTGAWLGAVEGTDYELDLLAGRIFVYSGSAVITDGDLATFDVAANAGADDPVDELRAITETSTVVALHFEQIDACTGARRFWRFHQVRLRADGDFALIQDQNEFATLNFAGSVEANESAHADSPFWTVRTGSFAA